jgi:hypothetical protein
MAIALALEALPCVLEAMAPSSDGNIQGEDNELDQACGLPPCQETADQEFACLQASLIQARRGQDQAQEARESYRGKAC